VIVAAQKLVKRGKLSKALNEYQKIIAEDSQDLVTRLEIAGLKARLKREGEAVADYISIAEQYSQSGNDDKAIDTYTLALQVDYTRMDIYEKLGELSEKRGLTKQAIAQYRNVAFLYEKAGNIKKTIEFIEKIVKLSPDDLTPKAKLAELFCRQGDKKQGLELFDKVVQVLYEHGRKTDLANVCRRIVEIFSEDANSAELGLYVPKWKEMIEELNRKKA